MKKGRPKKDNAVKSGELSTGLCYFSFITEKTTADKIRIKAAEKNMTIKDFMQELLAVALNDRLENISKSKVLYSESIMIKVLEKDERIIRKSKK